MPTLSNLITERDLIDFSQRFGVMRDYMGSRYFPDRKTRYIEQEYTRFARNANLPMVAKVHALDTEAHIGSRVPFEKVTVEELLIKEKINLTESMATSRAASTWRWIPCAATSSTTWRTRPSAS